MDELIEYLRGVAENANLPQYMRDRLTEAAAALEAAREDAQRWRWIRENYSRITVTSAFNREHGYGKFTTAAGTFETIDAAVDAAIDQARGKAGQEVGE